MFNNNDDLWLCNTEGENKQVPVFSYNKVKESKAKQYISIFANTVGDKL